MKNEETKQYAGLLTYITAASVIVTFILFLIFMYSINSNVEFSWEKPTQHFFQQWNTGISHVFFTFWTELGSYSGVGVITVCLMAWLWWKYRDYAGLLIAPLLVICTDRLNLFIKDLVGRERPMVNPSIDAIGFSFPSGHAMLSIVTYGFAAYFLAKYAQTKKKAFIVWVIVFVLIVSIGISRVVLSAHYPSDVLAGYCLGFVLLVIAIKLYHLLLTLWQRLKKKQ
ncbi:MAG: phosphatase PAP2 family protein [Bacillus sp. (in: firmicutes)]